MSWHFLDLCAFCKAQSVALVFQVSTITLQQARLCALTSCTTMYILHMASFTDVRVVFANAAWL